MIQQQPTQNYSCTIGAQGLDPLTFRKVVSFASVAVLGFPSFPVCCFSFPSVSVCVCLPLCPCVCLSLFLTEMLSLGQWTPCVLGSPPACTLSTGQGPGVIRGPRMQSNCVLALSPALGTRPLTSCSACPCPAALSSSALCREAFPRTLPSLLAKPSA